MRRGQWTHINVDGDEFQAEYLGSGKFAKAFRSADGERVFLFVKGCNMKEAISQWAEKLPHVPEIVRCESQTDRHGDDVQVFSMPYYEPLRASHKEAWAQYRELARACDKATRAIHDREHEKNHATGKGFRPFRWDAFARDIAQETINLADVPESLKSALCTMLDAISNYGSGVLFEFAPRNLGIDADGRLILRDICFDAGKMP